MGVHVPTYTPDADLGEPQRTCKDCNFHKTTGNQKLSAPPETLAHHQKTPQHLPYLASTTQHRKSKPPISRPAWPRTTCWTSAVQLAPNGRHGVASKWAELRESINPSLMVRYHATRGSHNDWGAACVAIGYWRGPKQSCSWQASRSLPAGPCGRPVLGEPASNLKRGDVLVETTPSSPGFARHQPPRP